jgi:hypothetical protein
MRAQCSSHEYTCHEINLSLNELQKQKYRNIVLLPLHQVNNKHTPIKTQNCASMCNATTPYLQSTRA